MEEYDVLPRGEYDFVRHDYYSPIPDLTHLEADTWERRSKLGGVDWSVPKAIDYIEEHLTPFVAELEIPPFDPGVPGEFFLHNGGFETVDAELLYAMVRAARPKHVIELGSGYSTLLIAMACRRNAIDGLDTVHEAFDPYPRPHILGEEPPPPTRVTAISATDIPLETFMELRAGDVLFVDTTHTVKLGSDVNFIILDVLPVLRPGVFVHFHDIFLPWEYPRHWVADMRWFWAEQYLLQAFLAHNSRFEVLVPAHAVAREQPDRLRRAIPSFRPDAAPGSWWIRTR